jgi:hypothetical protein
VEWKSADWTKLAGAESSAGVKSRATCKCFFLTAATSAPRGCAAGGERNLFPTLANWKI